MFVINILLLLRQSPREQETKGDETLDDDRDADEDAALLALLEAAPSDAFCSRVRCVVCLLKGRIGEVLCRRKLSNAKGM